MLALNNQMKEWFGQDKSKKWVDEVFSEDELSTLQGFANDEKTKEVVRKFILAGIYSNGTLNKGKSIWPDINWVFEYSLDKYLDDAALGNQIKTQTKAIQLVQTAFKEIDEYKAQPKNEPKETHFT